MDDEPVEEFGVLRSREITGQRLIEMMVRTDQPRQQDEAARVDDLVGLGADRGRRSDRFDDAAADEDRSVGDLAIVVVERRDEGRVTEKQRANGSVPAMIGIAALNAADRATFVATVGFAFEHSPWVADAAWDRRPFASVEALHAAMVDALMDAPEERRVAVIAAHPDLAGRAAREGRLTPSSQSEQASAGLDRLTAEQQERFLQLNTAYRERFGFPFVICAREHDDRSIVAALEERTHNDREAEIATALREVAKIARLRIVDTVSA
jgi:OHCU decarboxylase